MEVSVPSFAKLNLDLRVLGKRPDGYHELRTIFQTISLADRLHITYEPARSAVVELASSVNIPDNLVLRAARLVVERLSLKARIRFSLTKRIPMGAGLGGGSSNAAAVLLALPALARRPLEGGALLALAETLGSDVSFFLCGGTALGLGRGTELYPLPDQPAHAVLVVSTGIHVSTAEAYRSLDRAAVDPLTSHSQSPMLGEFQSVAWQLAVSPLEQLPIKNDFQQVVFQRHPELLRAVRKLGRLGALRALMTGSGSALFGVFPDSASARAAAARFPIGTVHPARFVSRRQYWSKWRRALGSSAEALHSLG